MDLGLDHASTQALQRDDPDRFWCLIPADPARRPALAALLAFNQELGRVAQQVSQPMAGFIRLQWWRDALAEAADGQPRRHPVALALPLLLQAGVALADLEGLIDAREREVDETALAGLDELVAHARATAGVLQRAMAAVTGGDLRRAERIGTAYGLVGIIRATRHLAGRSRHWFPVDLLERRGVRRDDLLAGRMSPGLSSAVRDILAEARRELEGLRPRRREAATPLLLICRYQARAVGRGGCDPFAAAGVGRPPWLALRLLLLQTIGR